MKLTDEYIELKMKMEYVSGCLDRLFQREFLRKSKKEKDEVNSEIKLYDQYLDELKERERVMIDESKIVRVCENCKSDKVKYLYTISGEYEDGIKDFYHCGNCNCRVESVVIKEGD